MLHIILGAHFRLRFILEIRLDGLDFLIAAARLMISILQGANLRFGGPLQFRR